MIFLLKFILSIFYLDIITSRPSFLWRFFVVSSMFLRYMFDI